jgi:hypothetical protein
MSKEEIINLLRVQFNGHVRVVERRPGIWQLLLPIFHEDGDMIDLFAEFPSNGGVRISDYGMTVMRLSYSYDLNTPRKEEIFHKILTQNQIEEQNGKLFIDVSAESLYPSLLRFAQVVGKVSNMRHFQREVIRSLFFEELDEVIMSQLQKFRPAKEALPIPNRDDLEVDYSFQVNSHAVYLFGIRDSTKARLAALSCLEFQKQKLRFKGFAVHEDFEALPRKDRVRITSAADKQFTSLDDFRDHAIEVFERESVT